MRRSIVAALSFLTLTLALPLRAQAAVPKGAVPRSAPLGGALRAFAPRLPGAVLSAPAAPLPSPSVPVLTAPAVPAAPEAAENAAVAAEESGFSPVTGRVAEAHERGRGLRALERLGGSLASGERAGADAGRALDLLFDRARAGRGDVSGVLAAAADGPGTARSLPRRRPVPREQALDRVPQAASLPAAARRSPGARQDGKAGVFLLSMLALFALGALLAPGNSAGFLVSALKLVGGVIAALLGFFGMVFVVDGYGVGDGLERLGRGLVYAALVIGGGWLAGPVLIALVL